MNGPDSEEGRLGDGRFNPGAWKTGEVLRVLVREVNGPAKPGMPDCGKMIYVELEDGRCTEQRRVWSPGDEIASLEDARASVAPTGLVVVGLTAVYRVDGRFEPHPAIVTLESNEKMGRLPRIQVLDVQGKNTTPLGIIDKGLIAYRPENDGSCLRVVHVDDGGSVHSEGRIDLSRSLPLWGEVKLGTASPPFWVNEHQALMPVHGISRDDNGMLVYSIGLSRLEYGRGAFEVYVDPDPLLTRGDFEGWPQLHPEERWAMYSTGGYLETRDGVEYLCLLVSVGDCRTVVRKWPMKELEERVKMNSKH